MSYSDDAAVMVELNENDEELNRLFGMLSNEGKEYFRWYTGFMEGSWGQLAYEDNREHHIKVLRASKHLNDEFVDHFEKWMEKRWEVAWEEYKDEVAPPNVISWGGPYNKMCAAESAYRDFHEHFYGI